MFWREKSKSCKIFDGLFTFYVKFFDKSNWREKFLTSHFFDAYKNYVKIVPFWHCFLRSRSKGVPFLGGRPRDDIFNDVFQQITLWRFIWQTLNISLVFHLVLADAWRSAESAIDYLTTVRILGQISLFLYQTRMNQSKIPTIFDTIVYFVDFKWK